MRPAPRRLTPLLLGLALATTALASPVAAQDETEAPEETLPPADCAILTTDEVSTAMGEALTLVQGEGASCQFDADYEAGRFMSLFTSVAEDTTIADVVSFLCPTGTPAPGESPEPCGVEVAVGDSVGSYIPEGFGTMLYVDAGDGDLLAVQLVGDPVEGHDRLAALTHLGALALPRMAGIPQPVETEGPAEPTFTPDNDLEALFPSEIGGRPLDIESFQGADAFADTDVPQAILDALAAQGKTLDDVSIATGYSFDSSTMELIMITAIQVAGGDMGSIADAFVQVFNGDTPPAEQTPAQVSGKDVTVIRPTAESTDDQLQYVYPHGDVLWVVAATEPALSEVFSKLP
jgi:hypothetical protein